MSHSLKNFFSSPDKYGDHRTLTECDRTDKFPDSTYHEDMETTPLNFDTLRLTINDTIKEKARLALIKIRDTKGIHLTELWLESDSYEDWKQEINDLLKRLS